MRTAMCKKLCGILALLMVLTAFLCACGGKKTAPTLKAFKKAADECGYEYQEAEDGCMIQETDGGYFMAAFVLADDEDAAKDAFEEASEALVEEGAKIKKGSNYQLCKYEDDEAYGYAILIDKTVVAVVCDIDRKSDAEDFIKALGL